MDDKNLPGQRLTQPCYCSCLFRAVLTWNMSSALNGSVDRAAEESLVWVAFIIWPFPHGEENSGSHYTPNKIGCNVCCTPVEHSVARSSTLCGPERCSLLLCREEQPDFIYSGTVTWKKNIKTSSQLFLHCNLPWRLSENMHVDWIQSLHFVA